MERVYWREYRNLKVEEPSAPVGKSVKKPIPVLDLPGLVADTSEESIVQSRRTLEPTFGTNRTYIRLWKGDTKGVPEESLRHRDDYHPVYPNYRRLNDWNGDRRAWKWERKEFTHPEEAWKMASAIMGHLDMTEYQKERFHFLFWKLDRQTLGLHTSKVIFGVSMLVCWEDGRRTHPLQVPWDDLFAEFADHERLLTPTPTSLFNRLKDQLSDWLKDETHRRKPPKPASHPYPQPGSGGKGGGDENPTAA